MNPADQKQAPVVPEDLRYDYEYAKRCGNDRLVPGYLAVSLIERIASLEASETALLEALKEAQEFGAQVAKHPWIDEDRLPSWNPQGWGAAIRQAEERRKAAIQPQEKGREG